ncbi:3Beta-HSD domain-containing protein [Mycena kentingensis (nom. inval.)]|nr:3Beta-HSD domain-containing protein [Mycena kentingensis (nom. inval.)]
MFLAILLLLYLYRLSVRLRSSCSSSEARSQACPRPTVQELDAAYPQITSMLKVVPPATHSGYAVVGGSGFLGAYIVRLLIMRGERNVRILDLTPPSAELVDAGVSFVKTDITSLPSTREGLQMPFSDGNPPKVIFHAAALIDFWSRATYSSWFAPSYAVNVLETQNILTVAKELDAIVVYTSSVDTVLAMPKFLRLDWDAFPVYVSDETHTPKFQQQGCYARSKRMAEQLVIDAHTNDGRKLKTGILRPGSSILGPGDRLISSALTMAKFPVWDELWVSSHICAWDAAAAHLVYENALRTRPDEVAGQAFLITGKGQPWSNENVREAIKHYAVRDLKYVNIPPLVAYFLAHLIEGFLFLRYFIVYPFFWLTKRKPSVAPKWLGQAVFLQPSTLELQLLDVVIDDSRAQKVLGYEPQWTTLQAIRYAVDEIQAGNVAPSHGLKLW